MKYHTMDFELVGKDVHQNKGDPQPVKSSLMIKRLQYASILTDQTQWAPVHESRWYLVAQIPLFSKLIWALNLPHS